MQVNANTITILNGIFVLDLIHDIDLDLNFVASTYNLVASNGKVHISYHLQPRKNIHVFTSLPTRDKVWEDDRKGLYAIGGRWASLVVDPKQYPILRVFTTGILFFTSSNRIIPSFFSMLILFFLVLDFR